MQIENLDKFTNIQLLDEIESRINSKLEDFSDAEIEEEYAARYLCEHRQKLEDYGDGEIIQEVITRGLEDDILDYNVKEMCEKILFALNTNKDIPRQLIVELVQNVTGKIYVSKN